MLLSCCANKQVLQHEKKVAYEQVTKDFNLHIRRKKEESEEPMYRQ